MMNAKDWPEQFAVITRNAGSSNAGPGNDEPGAISHHATLPEAVKAATDEYTAVWAAADRGHGTDQDYWAAYAVVVTIEDQDGHRWDFSGQPLPPAPDPTTLSWTRMNDEDLTPRVRSGLLEAGHTPRVEEVTVRLGQNAPVTQKFWVIGGRLYQLTSRGGPWSEGDGRIVRRVFGLVDYTDDFTIVEK